MTKSEGFLKTANRFFEGLENWRRLDGKKPVFWRFDNLKLAPWQPPQACRYQMTAWGGFCCETHLS